MRRWVIGGEGARARYYTHEMRQRREAWRARGKERERESGRCRGRVTKCDMPLCLFFFFQSSCFCFFANTMKIKETPDAATQTPTAQA